MRGAQRFAIVAALGASLVASVAFADGDEDEYPAYVDAPIAPMPGRALPFPVKEEAAPIAPSLIGDKALPVAPLVLDVPGQSAGSRYDTVLGSSLQEFQSLVVRQSHVDPGRVKLPAASVAYFVEAVPGAAPLGQDALSIGAKPEFLVDFEQSIVVRKALTIGIGESVVLGSSVIRYRSALPLAGTLAAAFGVETLGGMPWSELGGGGFEVSTTQPAWRARAFHEGLIQGRVEEVTDKQVRFAWLSSIRTDGIALADKLERGGKLKAGEEMSLPGDRKVKVTAVSPARFVTLDTPDGTKTLTAPPDLTVLPEDTEARKKLIVIGKDWAVVMNPTLSDFAAGQAQLFVYSGVHWYKNGELVEHASEWRAWPTALPNGRVLGLLLTNDKPIELDPKLRTLEGPGQAFQLITEWTPQGELASFVVEDAKGTRCQPVAAKGLGSIDFVSGAGPTARALMSRVRAKRAAPEPSAADAGATPAPSPVSVEPASPSFKSDPVGYVRPHLFWVVGGALFGFVVAALIGLLRRRRQSWE